MTIPFLSFLKKKPPLPIPAFVPAEKKEDERLSKTVTPNAIRTMGAEDTFDDEAQAGPAPVVRPVVSFRPNDLPPAVALALEPRVERTISVELADVVAQMPPGLTRPLGEGDAEHILLKASDVEKGMASGKPSVSAFAVYQQAPEIFLQTITNADVIQIALPFRKVLDQLSRMQVRADQNEEQVVPQVHTPFLQVTLEDDERFGTVTAVAQLHCPDVMPPGRLELATAESLAAAQPEAAASDRYVQMPSTYFPAPKNKNSNGAASEPAKTSSNGNAAAPTAVDEKPVIPEPIAFKLSPKGTDVPATERVPASSGPSVPTSSAAAASAPTRIPFKIAAPAAAETSSDSEPWLTKDNFVGEPASADGAEFAVAPAAPVDLGNLTLPLKPILQNVLPLQLTREITGVSDEAEIEIPFALLQPQLASGRVCLTPEQFAKYLPEEYRELFDPTMSDAPVALPLQEVLKNLPNMSLRMREDQVEQEEGEHFVTPFSTKAEEDAARFKVPATPIASPAKEESVSEVKEAVAATEETEAVEAETKSTEEKIKPFELASKNGAAAKPAAGKSKRNALQVELNTDDEVDAKYVVSRVTQMAGVKACAIVFGDGLSLAGNLPEQYQADGLCAIAPSLMQRTESHIKETQLGAFRSMTLSCAKAAVTFFMQDNLCLAAVHERKDLPLDIREHLARVLLELSHKYSHSA
ncbi:MAG: hypothetical protein ABI946_10985 [Chthoniobacterales bacterium]